MFLTLVKKFFRTYSLAFIAAVVLLTLTMLMFLEAYVRVDVRNQALFVLRAEAAKTAVEKRMLDYIQILKSAQGLFLASDTVNRQEWKEFVKILDVDRNYPGIQGLGYAPVLPPDKVDEFEEAVKKEDFPEFRVWPDDPRDTFTSILYLEPLNTRNKRALGFDMFSDSTRRKAMKRARDTGRPSLTAMVRLVQETNVEVQKGFLLYLPLYKEGANLSNVYQRRNALNGYVYSPFRVNDLMKGILQDRFKDLRLEIYDGTQILAENLVYETDTSAVNKTTNSKRLFTITPIQVGGHTWQLYITTMPGFGDSYVYPWLILGGGIILSGLIFAILFSLTNTRRSNYLRQLITDNATPALIILDKRDYCTFSNPAAQKLLGYTGEELKSDTFHQLVHNKYPDGTSYPPEKSPLIKSLAQNNTIYNLETVLFHKNGQQVVVNINAQPIYETGKVVSHLLEIRDIGPEKLAEQALLSKNRSLQTLNSIGQNLSAELELKKLIQIITDSCTELTGAEFGAFFYNTQNEKGESLTLFTLSGADSKAFADFPFPRHTAVFAPSFQGKSIVRSDDITLDPKYGKNAPFKGMPDTHLPVKSYLAVPVISRNGEALGVLLFGHSKAGVFTENTEDTVKGIAAQAAIAMDNSRLFETISHKNEELVKINNDLDSFVYTASHDLKAPVLNIEGLVVALDYAMKRNKPERMQEILEKIQLSIHKFKETIQALTEVAKTNKNLEEDVDCINIQELLDDVLFSISDILQQSDASIETALQQQEIRFSSANMRSILHNLLTNAIKYRSPERKPVIKVSCSRVEDTVILEVADNGLGIDPSYQSKIFTMFSRYHTHVEGTGIGLYLVKRIVENKGGTIVLNSEVGKGSTFTITLPAVL